MVLPYTAIATTYLYFDLRVEKQPEGEAAKAEEKAGGLAKDLVKAEQRTRLQQLKAPVDGTVQQLSAHTVGGVVTPAQTLLVVVPSDSRLEIEAMVSNRDIGFVHAGQQAEIKVDTFNFTRYGLLHGEVLSVSSDAIPRERPEERPEEREPREAAQALVGPAPLERRVVELVDAEPEHEKHRHQQHATEDGVEPVADEDVGGKRAQHQERGVGDVRDIEKAKGDRQH